MVAIEAEGLYNSDNYNYLPNNPALGSSGATRTYGGLANLKFGIPITRQFMGYQFNPYVAGGVGYGQVQYTGQNGIYKYRDTDDGFIWQAKAGVEMKLNAHLGVDLAYRYLQAPEFKISNAYAVKIRSEVQGLSIGLKYNY